MQSFLELHEQTQVAVAEYLYQYSAFPGIFPLVAQSDMITQLSCFPFQVTLDVCCYNVDLWHADTYQQT